ncbi:cation:proton antiporter regulatory subunit [Quadrisphaera sp. GCM10027208]|uniref:cation:proton antiporter regulatory subunit n=1 Tax=Quadrisphaera sp. GCM10027208 TaxID=3273423 RepID=UPI0036098833|nr:cation:proton antiporter regulatory subunit [Kineosporiaceae bacterium SCSIO 59966]
MDLVETLLPGVGIRYELTTRSGLVLGIVVQREGPVEIVVYDAKDPDRAKGVFQLDRDEAEAVADILGAPRLTERFADLSREVPGLRSGRFAIRPGSPFVDRPLGDTQARTRTGCSIVAIVRGADVVTSPGPGDVLRTGDVLVVIGSEQGLEQLGALLAGDA